MTNDQLWQAVLGELEITLSKANFTTWMKHTFVLDQENNGLIIAVPNIFTKSWLENKYQKYIVEAIQKISKNQIMDVSYKIATTKPQVEKNNIAKLKQAIKMEVETMGAEEEKNIDPHGLNSRYTFDNFVIGENNKLAHAAALAVCKNPGKSYNPLYIYGGVGLGKTHLLQAIGHEILKRHPKTKLLYITSERFTNDFVSAIRNKRVGEFDKKYQNFNILIIDDIQFIGGKEQTQEKLFHIFNNMHQINNQMILSSDRTPKAIPKLEPRLESRFNWGMIVDISEPDYETKVAIIETKLLERKFSLGKECIDYLATNLGSNIREIEGVINKIVAHHQLNNEKIDLDKIKNIVQTIRLQVPKGSITPKKIINIVADFYEVNVKDVTGDSRKKELVVPRQIMMYLMREETKASFPNIGQELGGRDHTTAMHSYSKIKNALPKDEKIKQDIILLRQRLYNE